MKQLQRHLQLSGCHNLRELGGYTNLEGKQIRWSTLLRSDCLDRLPLSSQQKLLEYGVKTIIDLRSSLEVNRDKYALSRTLKIEYLNLPLVDNREEIETIKQKTLLEHNYFFLEKRSPAIKTILETIATKQTAIVIHCAAGKDRTGIIIALLLALLNVPIATIAEDYQLSERALASLYINLREKAIKQGFSHLLESPAQIIIDTFAYLEQNYGGINNYLENIGIKLETRERLKNMLIE